MGVCVLCGKESVKVCPRCRMYVLCAECSDQVLVGDECVVSEEKFTAQEKIVQKVVCGRIVVGSFLDEGQCHEDGWRGCVVGMGLSGRGVFVKPVDTTSCCDTALWCSLSTVRMHWRHPSCYLFPEPSSWCDVMNSKGVWREGQVMWLGKVVVIVKVASGIASGIASGTDDGFEYVCRYLSHDYVAPLNTHTTSWRAQVSKHSFVEVRDAKLGWVLKKVDCVQRFCFTFHFFESRYFSSLDVAPPGTHVVITDGDLCPITFAPLVGTCAITAAGQVYNYAAIVEWLATKSTDPLTGTSLRTTRVLPIDVGDKVVLERVMRAIRSSSKEFDRRLAHIDGLAEGYFKVVVHN